MPTILFVGGTGKREATYWNSVAEACARENFRFFGVYQGFWGDQPEITHAYISTGPFDQDFTKLFNEAEPTSPEETSVRVATFVVSQLRPQLAIVWNGLDRTQAIWARFLLDAGVPTLISERAAFPGLFYFERKGINGLSEFLWDEERIERSRTNGGHAHAQVRRVYEFVRASRAVSYRMADDVSGFSLRDAIQATTDEKIVLFLGSWDQGAGIVNPDPEVRRAQSPLFASSCAAALALADAVQAVGGCRLVLRPHPLDHDDWSSVASGTSTHLLPNSDVIDLIEQSDVVAGVTTNLLYHAAVYDKPVIIMGRTALSAKGFSYDVEETNQLLPLLQQALSWTDREARLAARDRFFAEYLFRFCYSAEEDFRRLGIPGPEKAAGYLIEQSRAAAQTIADPADGLFALGNAVSAVNRKIEQLEWQLLAIEPLEKQVQLLETYRRSTFLFLRFRAGLIAQKLKRVPGLRAPIELMERSLQRKQR